MKNHPTAHEWYLSINKAQPDMEILRGQIDYFLDQIQRKRENTMDYGPSLKEMQEFCDFCNTQKFYQLFDTSYWDKFCQLSKEVTKISSTKSRKRKPRKKQSTALIQLPRVTNYAWKKKIQDLYPDMKPIAQEIIRFGTIFWSRDLEQALGIEEAMIKKIEIPSGQEPLKSIRSKVDLRKYCSPIENQLTLGSCKMTLNFF